MRTRPPSRAPWTASGRPAWSGAAVSKPVSKEAPSIIGRVSGLGAAYRNRTDDLPITSAFPGVARQAKAHAAARSACCCWCQLLAVPGRSGTSGDTRISPSEWDRQLLRSLDGQLQVSSEACSGPARASAAPNERLPRGRGILVSGCRIWALCIALRAYGVHHDRESSHPSTDLE